MPQQRTSAIVGIYEYPLRVVGEGTGALQIKAASAAKALEDAGLAWKDVDAVYDTGGDQGVGGLGISEYFGLKPNIIRHHRGRWDILRVPGQPRPQNDHRR